MPERNTVSLAALRTRECQLKNHLRLRCGLGVPGVIRALLPGLPPRLPPLAAVQQGRVDPDARLAFGAGIPRDIPQQEGSLKTLTPSNPPKPADVQEESGWMLPAVPAP